MIDIWKSYQWLGKNIVQSTGKNELQESMHTVFLLIRVPSLLVAPHPENPVTRDNNEDFLIKTRTLNIQGP